MEITEYRNISFSGAYDAGEYLYTSNSLFNGMLKLYKETGSAVYLKRFEEEGILRRGLHGRVFRYNDEIIFTPDAANGLHIYNMVREEMRFYPIQSGDGNRTRCIDSFFDGGKLWLFYAYSEQAVVIFDLDNHTQEIFYGVQNILPKEIKNRKSVVFWSKMERKERKIYGVIWRSQYIVQVDMDSYEVELYACADQRMDLIGLTFDGDCFWLTEHAQTHVIKWKPQEKMEIVKAPDELHEAKGLVYFSMLCHKDKVILLPSCGEYIWYIDKERMQLCPFCKLPQEISEFGDLRKKWRRFLCFDIVENDVLRMYPSSVNMMIDINLNTAEVEGYTFTFDDSWDDEKYMKKIVFPYISEDASQKCLNESKDMDLSLYLDYVVNSEA